MCCCLRDSANSTSSDRNRCTLALMSPLLRTLVLTIIVPGFWTVLVPYWVIGRGARPDLRGAGAAGLLLAGVALRSISPVLSGALRCEARERRPLLILQRNWSWKARIGSCGIPCIGAWH